MRYLETDRLLLVRLEMVFTGFLPGFTGLYWVLLVFIRVN